jgi:hypothetical protein
MQRSYYVICMGTREDMTARGYYSPSGQVVPDGCHAAKFEHLTDMLEFIETYGIELDRTNFISHVCMEADPGRGHGTCELAVIRREVREERPFQ